MSEKLRKLLGFGNWGSQLTVYRRVLGAGLTRPLRQLKLPLFSLVSLSHSILDALSLIHIILDSVRTARYSVREWTLDFDRFKSPTPGNRRRQRKSKKKIEESKVQKRSRSPPAGIGGGRT